ncbi:MAG TPA: DUF2911 domain-containing protein [Terriglobia bacterium]|nr:DUF2911 domain-containing protein [Terriglobia bacterium]
MKTVFFVPAFALALAMSTQAQQAPKIAAEGGGIDDRASARVLYWNDTANAAAGQFAIDYGRPAWKPQYDDPATFDKMTKGRVWRMGSNFWTALDTCLPLKIGGRSVKPGYYFLGVHRSADGATWSLAFIDPAAVRASHLDAFQIGKAAIWFEAPITMTQAGSKAEKLTITLSYPKEDFTHVTMKLDWGNVELTTPIEVELPQ